MPVLASQKEGVHCFCITNEDGVKLNIISLGATITALQLPDGYGETYILCLVNIFQYVVGGKYVLPASSDIPCSSII